MYWAFPLYSPHVLGLCPFCTFLLMDFCYIKNKLIQHYLNSALLQALMSVVVLEQILSCPYVKILSDSPFRKKKKRGFKIMKWTTVHLWCNSYSTSINAYGVRGPRPKVQVSKRKFQTHLHQWHLLSKWICIYSLCYSLLFTYQKKKLWSRWILWTFLVAHKKIEILISELFKFCTSSTFCIKCWFEWWFRPVW